MVVLTQVSVARPGARAFRLWATGCRRCARRRGASAQVGLPLGGGFLPSLTCGNHTTIGKLHSLEALLARLGVSLEALLVEAVATEARGARYFRSRGSAARGRVDDGSDEAFAAATARAAECCVLSRTIAAAADVATAAARSRGTHYAARAKSRAVPAHVVQRWACAPRHEELAM